MKYAFPVAETPSVPVAGTDLAFPVRRIYCVGRNYREHTREMGFEPERDPPFFFMKPADAIVESGATIPYPSATRNLHHEIELVVAIGKRGVNVARDEALEHVYGYAVGIDLTRRDLQLAARDKGRPWDVGKGFDRSAPTSHVQRAAAIGHPSTGALWLEVNGTLRQKADIAELIWPIPDVIAFLSKLYELEAGDLIFTGTPAGVGPIEPGDSLRGGVEGVGEVALRIAPHEAL